MQGNSHQSALVRAGRNVLHSIFVYIPDGKHTIRTVETLVSKSAALWRSSLPTIIAEQLLPPVP
jgi:hypothetical protein